jgi:GDP-L-fucose synthase
VVWGSGTPRREFLYVDDLADACVFLMDRGVVEGMYNVGTGEDVTIRELAETVMSVTDSPAGSFSMTASRTARRASCST